MNNDANWNGSGGPWMPLAQAMQIVVTSETLEAPGHDDDALSPRAFMKDVTVRDGILALRAGMKCRVLVLPECKSMTTMMMMRINLLINRMIGAEFLPEDSERTAGHGAGVLKEMKWPQWVEEGKPNPTGRYPFSTWRGWNKDDPLQKSELVGPVTLVKPKVKLISQLRSP